MRNITLILLLGALLLSACNLPVSPRPTGDGTATAEANQVATQVAQMLNQAPTTLAQTVVAAPTQAPTKAPEATKTPAPTVTVAPTQAKPTPTTPNGDPKNSLGTPTWVTNFESDKGYHLYDNGNTKVSYEPGALVFTGQQANGWLGWSMITSKPSQNFYLEGTFQTQTCSGGDLYGLVFRAPNTNSGYFFGVTCDGKYNLYARDFDANTSTALIQATASSAITTGSDQTNRLGVLANGSQLKLYVNGTLVHEISDSTYTGAGSFGGQVAANATAGFTVKLTQISLWQLP